MCDIIYIHTYMYIYIHTYTGHVEEKEGSHLSAYEGLDTTSSKEPVSGYFMSE